MLLNKCINLLYHLFAEPQKSCTAFLVVLIRISICVRVAELAKVVSLSSNGSLWELRKMMAVTVMPWLTYGQLGEGVIYSLSYSQLLGLNKWTEEASNEPSDFHEKLDWKLDHWLYGGPSRGRLIDCILRLYQVLYNNVIRKLLHSEYYKRTYIKEATKLLKADKSWAILRTFRNDHHIRRAICQNN